VKKFRKKKRKEVLTNGNEMERRTLAGKEIENAFVEKLCRSRVYSGPLVLVYRLL
jgi:hypothetical protein